MEVKSWEKEEDPHLQPARREDLNEPNVMSVALLIRDYKIRAGKNYKSYLTSF